jgi:hypothetical protein
MAKSNLARKLGKIPAFRTFAVSLTPEVAAVYEAQAEDRDTGAVLSDRLEDPIVMGHTSEKALYFSDEDRRELEALMEYNFSSAKQVIERLRSLFTVVRIMQDDSTYEDVLLSPNQVFRLTERARIAGKTVPQLAKELGIRGINQEIGLF